MAQNSLNLSLGFDSEAYSVEIKKMGALTSSFAKSASQSFTSIAKYAGHLNAITAAASLVVDGIGMISSVVDSLSQGQNKAAVIAEKYNGTVGALSGSARSAQEGLDRLQASITELSASQARASLKEVAGDYEKVKEALTELVTEYGKYQDAFEGMDDESAERARSAIENRKSTQGVKEGVNDSIAALLQGKITLQEYKDVMSDAFTAGSIGSKERLEELIALGATYVSLSNNVDMLKSHLDSLENSAQKTGKALQGADAEECSKGCTNAATAVNKLNDKMSKAPEASTGMTQVGDATIQAANTMAESLTRAANALDALNNKLLNQPTAEKPAAPVSNGEKIEPVPNGEKTDPTWSGGFTSAANNFSNEWTNAASIAEKQFGVLARSMESLGTMAVDSIFDGAEFRVDKLFEDIAKQLLRIVLMQAMASAVSGISSGISSLFPPSAHTGGIAGIPDANAGRRVSPLVFADAPRYHTGGIAGLRSDEIPSILQRGEGIFTRAQMQAIGGGLSAQPQIDINFIDQTSGGADVKMQQTPTSNGGMRLDLTIIDVVNGNINSGGKLDQTIRGKYGLNARPNGR